MNRKTIGCVLTVLALLCGMLMGCGTKEDAPAPDTDTAAAQTQNEPVAQTEAGSAGQPSVSNQTTMDGTWVPVLAEMSGTQLTGDRLQQATGEFIIVLRADGTGEATVNGESGAVSWERTTDSIQLTVDGERIDGQLGDNCFTVSDLLQSGVKVIFAKQGTAAADPVRYMDELSQALIGDWVSETVQASDGTQQDSGQDALRLTVHSDHTAELTYMGEDKGSFDWLAANGTAVLDTDDPNVRMKILEDGRLEVTYTAGEDAYTIRCIRK